MGGVGLVWPLTETHRNVWRVKVVWPFTWTHGHSGYVWVIHSLSRRWPFTWTHAKVTVGVGVLSTPSVEDDFSPGSKVTLDVCGLSTSWVGDLSPWPKVTHDLSPGPEVSLDVCELATPWVEGDLSPGPKVTLGVGVLSTPWVGESSVTFYWDPRSTWVCHVWYVMCGTHSQTFEEGGMTFHLGPMSAWMC